MAARKFLRRMTCIIAYGRAGQPGGQCAKVRGMKVADSQEDKRIEEIRA
jgi:hypothetical protein